MESHTYNGQNGVKIRGATIQGDDGGVAVNIVFLPSGKLRVWTTAGESVILSDSDLLPVLHALQRRFPLDALASI